MRGLDGLAIVGPALMLVIGLFAQSIGEPAVTLMTIVGSLSLMLALNCARLSLHFVMDLADDLGFRRGLPHAALWMLRAGSAFWLWLALAFCVLAQFQVDLREVMIRVALISVAIAAAVFVLGVGWFITYARAKERAHTPLGNRSNHGGD